MTVQQDESKYSLAKVVARVAMVLVALVAALAVLQAMSAQPARAEFLPYHLAFESNRDGNWEIYSIHRYTGTDLRRLTYNSASDANPSWSKRCQKIVFKSNRDGNWEIYSMNTDGTGLRRLTYNSASDVDPSVTDACNEQQHGSGTDKIVWTSNRTGNWEIYSMKFDGTGFRQLTVNAAEDADPAVSPYGGRIYFESTRAANREIYSMLGDGSSQKRITYNGAEDADASVGSGINEIVFRSNRDGNHEIYKMENASSPEGPTNVPRRLTYNSVTDAEPVLFGHIFFDSYRDGNREVYRMAKDGSNQDRLTFHSASDGSPG